MNPVSAGNLLECPPSTAGSVALPGFQSGVDFHITYFPTRMDTTTLPDSHVDTLGTGTVSLDLSTSPFGGIAGYHLDTLRSDYAFIIATGPVVRSMRPISESTSAELADEAIHLYPNPSTSVVYVRMPDDSPIELELLDAFGRPPVRRWYSQSGPLHQLDVDHLPSGSYSLRITGKTCCAVKKLIIP